MVIPIPQKCEETSKKKEKKGCSPKTPTFFGDDDEHFLR
jgi:hypothetical protein